jgi:hypothetical protein
MKEVSNLGDCEMRNFIIPTGLNMHLRLGGQEMQEEFGCRDLWESDHLETKYMEG